MDTNAPETFQFELILWCLLSGAKRDNNNLLYNYEET